MTTNVTMIAPTGSNVESFQARSGNQYAVTTTNSISTISVAIGDVVDALNAGFVITNLPAGLQTLFGSGGLGFNEEGNLYRNVGNPIAGNGADTTDDILGGFVLSASSFDIAFRGLNITAQGKTGATTNNKRFKIFVNPTMSGQTVTGNVISGGSVSAGTPLCDSGVWVNGTTPNNAAGWSANANLFKYGAAGSNTQYGQSSAILGTLHGGIQAPQFLTLPENAVINIVVTGSSYTTGAANDVILEFLEINVMN